MYDIFTYMYHKNPLNVGKYIIHGWYQIVIFQELTFHVIFGQQLSGKHHGKKPSGFLKHPGFQTDPNSATISAVDGSMHAMGWNSIKFIVLRIHIPIGSMYGLFTYMWLKFMVNVGKYTIHGSYGICPKNPGFPLYSYDLFGWDWNPKNPHSIGRGEGILRDNNLLSQWLAF